MPSTMGAAANATSATAVGSLRVASSPRGAAKVALALTIALLLMAGCRQRTIYHHYCATPVEGWEMIDTLTYTVDTLTQTDNYAIELGVRTSQAVGYPFQTLWIEVRQVWYTPGGALEQRCDTLACKMTNPMGDSKGQGTSMHQFCYGLDTLRLSRGTWGYLRVRHIMRRDLLPGVTDVGIRIYSP